MTVGTPISLSTLAGPFVAQATARGLRPPLSIVDAGTRGWPVADSRGDLLVIDEFGDGCWCRTVRPGEVRSIRSCWPEEIRRFADQIQRCIDTILGAHLRSL